MVWETDFQFKTDQERYVTGQTVTGSVEMIVPGGFVISDDNLRLRFRCLAETKWPESHGNPSPDHTGYVSYDKYEYLNVELPISQKDIFTKNADDGAKKLQIPFSYTIPKDPKLPSTMVSNHGFVQYFLELIVRSDGEVKTFTREVIVRSPVDKHLMIAVVGTASKYVILHNGSVTMTASIPRKGYAPGEIITVTLDVNNQTNVAVTPRLSLIQTQIYMCGSSHKSVETSFNEEPIVGATVGANQEVEELIQLKVPDDEALTIASAAVSVKYFVHITLDIPTAFDLHINLPVVMTSKEVIAGMLAKEQSNEMRLLKK